MKQFIFKVTVILPNKAKHIFYCCDDNISNIPYHFCNVTFRGETIAKFISAIERIDEYNIIGYGEQYQIPYGIEDGNDNDID